MTTAALKPNSNSWTLRLFTLLIWLLVGLCAAYWAFKFITTKSVEASTAQSAPSVVIDSKAIGRLLGATDVVATKVKNTRDSTKFTLFGLANTAGGHGYALIAVDGKPAKPYRVGSLVADDLRLKSISKTGVILADSLKSPDAVTLELPERKAIINSPNNFASPPPPSMVVGQPRFQAPNFNNVPPPATAMPLVAQPGSIAPVTGVGAALGAAGSRFAPRASAADGAVASPDTSVSTINPSVSQR